MGISLGQKERLNGLMCVVSPYNELAFGLSYFIDTSKRFVL